MVHFRNVFAEFSLFRLWIFPIIIVKWCKIKSQSLLMITGAYQPSMLDTTKMARSLKWKKILRHFKIITAELNLKACELGITSVNRHIQHLQLPVNAI